jgi:hypothetical protein
MSMSALRVCNLALVLALGPLALAATGCSGSTTPLSNGADAESDVTTDALPGATDATQEALAPPSDAPSESGLSDAGSSDDAATEASSDAAVEAAAEASAPACVLGQAACLGNSLVSCDDGGTWSSPAPCANMTCVGAVFSADAGTATPQGDSGTLSASCSGSCAPGALGCYNQQPQSCGPTGDWQNMGNACSGTTPVCTAGSCVQCLAPADCPQTGTVCASTTCNNMTCGVSQAPLGTPCSDNGGVVCTGSGTCTASHCSDKITDADETDVDCGGSTCPKCVDGKLCKAGSDCADGVCGGTTTLTCQAPSCSDHVKNGNETDIDCGGGTCGACGNGKLCGASNSNCASGDCKSGTCVSCGGYMATDACCPNGSGNIIAYAGASYFAGNGIRSCDGRFLFIMQGDGNLVQYEGNTPLWATNTAGRGVMTLVMQGDGNLVMYPWNSVGSNAVWASNTAGNPGAYLAVQNDGNVVIYTSSGVAIWSTGTCCH